VFWRTAEFRRTSGISSHHATKLWSRENIAWKTSNRSTEYAINRYVWKAKSDESAEQTKPEEKA